MFSIRKRIVRTLGQVLKTARRALKKTLRQVESTSGISNGYLSQLESDSIKQPSPNHLHRLALEYGLAYADLMQLAGYAVAGHIGTTVEASGETGLTGIADLTEEDRRKIESYIQDLRDARRVRGGST